LDWSNQNTWS